MGSVFAAMREQDSNRLAGAPRFLTNAAFSSHSFTAELPITAAQSGIDKLAL